MLEKKKLPQKNSRSVFSELKGKFVKKIVFKTTYTFLVYTPGILNAIYSHILNFSVRYSYTNYIL